MSRIVKKPDVRRLEIIQAAEKLFQKNGYENTPVEAIIKEAGIAKGTFYYYFKAKKDILQALVNQINSGMIEYFNSIIEKSDLNAIEKLHQMIRGPVKSKKVKSIAMKIIHHPENRELQEKLNIESIKCIAPLLLKVIEQGYKEGKFKKLASIENVQIILAGSQFMMDSGLFKLTSKKRLALLKSIQQLFEFSVGAKSNALHFIAKESMRKNSEML